MSYQSCTRPTDSRPYSVADLAAIRVDIPKTVALILKEDDYHFRASLALQSAAYYLTRGATAEAHQLITEAAKAVEQRQKAEAKRLGVEW